MCRTRPLHGQLTHWALVLILCTSPCSACHWDWRQFSRLCGRRWSQTLQCNLDRGTETLSVLSIVVCGNTPGQSLWPMLSYSACPDFKSTYRASSWRSGSAQWPWSRVWWGPGVSHASQHCWCISGHLRERSCAPWCLQRDGSRFKRVTVAMGTSTRTIQRHQMMWELQTVWTRKTWTKLTCVTWTQPNWRTIARNDTIYNDTMKIAIAIWC